MRRAGRLLAALAIAGGALTAPPTPARALGRPCAAGQTRVTVVIDHGGSGAPSAVCVAANSSDNGATVLATRASMLGLPQPRFDASGLLCGIDGLPADGCGTHQDGKYSYWAYFHGTNGSWSYANIGPAGSRVSPAVVEGWRWEPQGSGLPNDPPPRAPASTAACAPAPSPPPAPTNPPPIASAGSTSPRVIDPAPKEGTTSPRAGPGGTTSPTTAVTPISRTKTVATSSTVASTSERALAARPTARRSNDGAPVGLIVGVLLVAVLAAGGGIAARRRNRPAT